MARTDTHRPAALAPADYDFVAFDYLKCEDLGDALFLQENRKRKAAHMARTGGAYSGHEHGGNCFICGASAMYTATFHHRPTNVYIRTGLECADKLEHDSGEGELFRKRVRSALEQTAGKKKAKATLEAAGVSKAWDVFTSTEEGKREESIICDIVGKLVQYGNISPAQLAFVRRLVDAIENRATIEATRAAEQAAAAPVPAAEKRITVTGKVLTIRQPDAYDQFGTVRMLVQHDTGWKVWGSVPSSIIGSLSVGSVVQFDASVKPSDKDTKFGFYSRPTKAKILKQAA